MTVNIVTCAGFSPSALVVRRAVRRIAAAEDVLVVSPCPAAAGVPGEAERIRGLDPSRTVAVEGCDACCGLQELMKCGVPPAQLVILDRGAQFGDDAVSRAEERISAALRLL